MGINYSEHDLLQQVKDYERKVLNRAINCIFSSCPKCHCKLSGFKLHEARSRIFLVIVFNEIQKIISLITRWKCPICGGTSTQYPEFALPYKRYTLPQIIDFISQYLEDDEQTYRKTVTRDNSEFYHAEKSDEEDTPVLAHSTLYHWITYFAKFKGAAKQALNYINQKDPDTGIFRKIAALGIPDKKYRSELRRKILLNCRELLCVEREFFRVFNKFFIFPNFATTANCK